MKILIVDDELPARERLKGLLSDINTDNIIVEAGNGLMALEKIEIDLPDVVLLDIRMPVMDGLETAYHMAAIEHAPAIIFTTAYLDHAIDAFDANAVDYLLKPIRRDKLQRALDRARVVNQGRIADIMETDPDRQTRSHLSASSAGKIELIPLNNIRCLKAEQKYVTVSCPGRQILVNESLKSLEQEFRHLFLRVHRNALVALNFIESIEKDETGNYYIHLRDIPERLGVSRRHLRHVRHVIKDLGR